MASYEFWLPAIKYVSLITTALLGVIGTLKETRETKTAKLTSAGKTMLVGIVISAIVSIIGQALEIRQQVAEGRQAAARRAEELRFIKQTAAEQSELRRETHRQSLPFASRFEVSGQISIPLDAAALKPFRRRLDAYVSRYPQSSFTVPLPQTMVEVLTPVLRPMGLVVGFDCGPKSLDFAVKSLDHRVADDNPLLPVGGVTGIYVNRTRATVSIEYLAHIKWALNDGMTSLLDFGGCTATAHISNSAEAELDGVMIEEPVRHLTLPLLIWERAPIHGPTAGASFVKKLPADVSPGKYGGWM